MKDNPFNFENSKGYISDWECFWENTEREWAEQFKFDSVYNEWSCECGSSTCDECNPGWDQEPEEWEEEPW